VKYLNTKSGISYQLLKCQCPTHPHFHPSSLSSFPLGTHVSISGQIQLKKFNYKFAFFWSVFKETEKIILQHRKKEHDKSESFFCTFHIYWMPSSKFWARYWIFKNPTFSLGLKYSLKKGKITSPNSNIHW